MPNEKSQEKERALFMAIRVGNLPEVKQCLLNGARTDVRCFHGETHLIMAVKGNHREVAQFLLEHVDGKKINNIDDSGNTALHIAASRHNPDMIQLLLSNGAADSLSITNKMGFTPLHLAILGKLKDSRVIDTAAKILAISNAGINQPNRFGRTPLHTAVVREDMLLTGLLLENGAVPSLNTFSKEGVTPLTLACQTDKAMAKLLINSLIKASPIELPHIASELIRQRKSFVTGLDPTLKLLKSAAHLVKALSMLSTRGPDICIEEHRFFSFGRFLSRPKRPPRPAHIEHYVPKLNHQ